MSSSVSLVFFLPTYPSPCTDKLLLGLVAVLQDQAVSAPGPGYVVLVSSLPWINDFYVFATSVEAQEFCRLFRQVEERDTPPYDRRGIEFNPHYEPRHETVTEAMREAFDEDERLDEFLEDNPGILDLAPSTEPAPAPAPAPAQVSLWLGYGIPLLFPPRLPFPSY